MGNAFNSKTGNFVTARGHQSDGGTLQHNSSASIMNEPSISRRTRNVEPTVTVGAPMTEMVTKRPEVCDLMNVLNSFAKERTVPANTWDRQTYLTSHLMHLNTSSTEASAWPAPANTTRRIPLPKDNQDPTSALDRQLGTISSKFARDPQPMPYSAYKHDLNEKLIAQDRVVSFLWQPSHENDDWVANNQGAKEQSGFVEALREPAIAVRNLVHSRLFLLDDHCFPCTIRRKGKPSGSGSSFNQPSTSSKQQLLQSAIARVVLDNANVGDPDEGNSVERDRPPSNKQMAVENALARHAEALTDAVLEMVFKHVESKDAPSGPTGSHVKAAAAVKPTDIRASGKRKREEETQFSSVEMVGPRYNWQHVLAALNQQAGNSVKVHQDLPALPLSDAVRERVERRLRALMQNDVPLPHKRVVPSVHTLAVRTQQSVDRDAAAAEGDSRGSAKKNKKIGGWQPAQLKPVYWDT